MRIHLIRGVLFWQLAYPLRSRPTFFVWLRILENVDEVTTDFFVQVGGHVAVAPGRAYDSLASMVGSSSLPVPSMVDEEERTKLSIKQKAAELSKKTRSSFRRKNTVNSSGRQRRLLIPRERPKTVKGEEKTPNDDNDNEDHDEGGF